MIARFAFLVLLLCSAQAALACTCNKDAFDAGDVYRDADAIFIGEVVSVSVESNAQGNSIATIRDDTVTFKVIRAWKGVAAGQTVHSKTRVSWRCNRSVFTAVMEEDVRRTIRPEGTTWLVVVYGSEPWVLSGCSPTQPRTAEGYAATVRAIERVARSPQ